MGRGSTSTGQGETLYAVMAMLTAVVKTFCLNRAAEFVVFPWKGGEPGPRVIRLMVLERVLSK